MLIFKINNNDMNKNQNNNNNNNLKMSKNRIKSTPPSKNKHSSTKNEYIDNKENKENKKKKYIKNIFIKKKKKLIDKIQNILNLQKNIKFEDDSNKTFIVTNNYAPTIKIRKPIVNTVFYLF